MVRVPQWSTSRSDFTGLRAERGDCWQWRRSSFAAVRACKPSKKRAGCPKARRWQGGERHRPTAQSGREAADVAWLVLTSEFAANTPTQEVCGLRNSLAPPDSFCSFGSHSALSILLSPTPQVLVVASRGPPATNGAGVPATGPKAADSGLPQAAQRACCCGARRHGDAGLFPWPRDGKLWEHLGSNIDECSTLPEAAP
jgi:hypothetical protein